MKNVSSKYVTMIEVSKENKSNADVGHEKWEQKKHSRRNTGTLRVRLLHVGKHLLGTVAVIADVIAVVEPTWMEHQIIGPNVR